MLTGVNVVPSSSTLTMSAAPSLMSGRRIATLIAAIFVSLSAGTNYVYSAYSPQLGSRLNINHTRLNVVGLAGNVGVYLTGPIWGKIVDSDGPKKLYICAFLFLLAGYSGIKYIYDFGSQTFHDSTSTLSETAFAFLLFSAFLTGAGGNAGLTSSVNVAAKSFPDRRRATAAGLVKSGFGLSALVFGTIAKTLFPGNTSSLLLVLALGTSLPMLVGLGFVRVVPLSPGDEVNQTEHAYRPLASSHNNSEGNAHLALDDYLTNNESSTSLIARDDNDDHESHHRHIPRANLTSNYRIPEGSNVVELNPTKARPSPSGNLHRTRTHISNNIGDVSSKTSTRASHQLEVHGKALILSPDFWILFTTMSMLSGTGLMWINNVGSVAQALYARGNPNYDQAIAAQWQANQVSVISFGNFLGRILIGLLSDTLKQKYGLPRTFCICIVSASFVISQLIAISITEVASLWQASFLLGLSYGSMFGTMLIIVIDAFGLAHFSENWGVISLSPLIGGNLFSLAFGRNLDAHAEPEIETRSIAYSVITAIFQRAESSASSHQCFQGRECYVSSLYMAAFACTFALVLSIVETRIDMKRAGEKVGPVETFELDG